MVDLKETMVANGIAILMMWFLIYCRRRNRESLHTSDKIYDVMCFINLGGAFSEAISFIVDGRDFSGGRVLNILSNSLCFSGTVTIGFLWCLYVDLRVNQNYKRTFRNARFLAIPWLAELAFIILNVFKPGIMFSVSEDNFYQRSEGAVLGYISLVFYLSYSAFLVFHSRRKEFNLHFFPVQYFIGPCLAGVLVQFFFYGLTTSWVSVAIALMFVQMQLYAENLYIDELSGLFNRRYLKGVIAKRKITDSGSLYGIMMDINSFKKINDTFGHGLGDRAICTLGDVLLRSTPDGCVAIRYAGDEFVVLLLEADEPKVISTMSEIRYNLKRLNETGAEPFALTVSMGYACFEKNDDSESFLKKMDEKMYEDKRQYHLEQA